MQTIDNKIISRIYGNGRGYSFSQNEFSDLGSTDAVRKSLSRLEHTEKIRRVLRGIYDYPKYSKRLKQRLLPDIPQIASALARKFNWRISPTGDTALNVLGLSTQVPGRYIYLCDGVNRSYLIGNLSLEFKKTTLKEIGFKYQKSELLVQAIKALTKERITDEIIQQLHEKLTSKQCTTILKDTKLTTTWIYEVIKKSVKSV